MISGAKLIENEVVVGDDVRCGQYAVVSREMGIACECNVVPQTCRTAASGVHTVLRHASGDDELLDPSFFEFMLKCGFEEGIRFLLPDDGFAIGWLQRWMNLPAFCMCLQRMSLCTMVLNVDHWNSRSACFPKERFDFEQHAPLDFGGHQCHQPDLHVYDRGCMEFPRTDSM
jgi:hypothetical protein